jgi:hypothetical protein
MNEQESQAFVRETLARRPAEQLPAGFSARLAARLDQERSPTWMSLLDWRTWSLRLLPAALVLWVWAALGGHVGSRAVPTDVNQDLTAWETGGGMSVMVMSPDVSDNRLLVALIKEDRP